LAAGNQIATEAPKTRNGVQQRKDGFAPFQWAGSIAPITASSALCRFHRDASLSAHCYRSICWRVVELPRKPHTPDPVSKLIER
jgi:hypothetical protein